MTPPRTLKIVEIFPSFQGEGLRQGEPVIFVRLAGCNLRCSFCDTKYAWHGGRDLGIAEILREIRLARRRFPAEWICLTGGEPFLQDIRPLVLSLKKAGLKVQIETNGTIFKRLGADWLTVSPKPKNYVFDPRLRTRAREVKLIVSRELAFATLERIRREFPPKTPLLLQAESNAPWSMAKGLRLQSRALRRGFTNIRVSAQLHKVYHRP